MILLEYNNYIDIWDPVTANELPPHRNINHQIQLIDGSIPVIKKAYGLSHEQAAIVKEYIDEMLKKSFIRPSNLPYAVLILIVKKFERSLQVCVDYCAFNALTIKNRNTSLFIWEILACLSSAKIYSKFDIIAAFNEIRI